LKGSHQKYIGREYKRVFVKAFEACPIRRTQEEDAVTDKWPAQYLPSYVSFLTFTCPPNSHPSHVCRNQPRIKTSAGKFDLGTPDDFQTRKTGSLKFTAHAVAPPKVKS